MRDLAEPRRFAYGGYVAELVDRLTVEDHPVPELYELLDEALKALEQGPATTGLLRAFELQLLVRAGYAPPFDVCGSCHDRLPLAEPVFLDAARGVFRCARCRGQGPTVEIGAGVIERLAALRDLPIGECRTRPFGEVAAEAAQLTGRLIEQHLTRPLESTKLIAQLAGARS
jgi:DNA repair protein RecO